MESAADLVARVLREGMPSDLPPTQRTAARVQALETALQTLAARVDELTDQGGAR